MKKTLSLFLIMIVTVLIFVSCNGETTIDLDATANIVTSNNSTLNNTNIDSNGDTNNNLKNDNSSELCEKYGNKVYFGCEEKTTYYSEIREYKEISNCFEVPSDENGTKKVGAYLKFIETYDELSTYILPAEFDSSIFDSNYVACIKQFFYDDAHEKRLIGYYDLNFSDGKYYISLDYYKSIDQVPHEQTADPYEITTYIIVPKNSVEYAEQLQQITVNGRNDIEDEIHMDDDHLISTLNESSHSYITHNASATLPKTPSSWVIKTGSELEKTYGLKYHNKYSNIDFRVVLYMPNEPNCDFIITEKEIKNGNLYLTIEEYSQYTNDYLNKNDVKFYDLYIQDTSELSENFDVYILVKTINNN